MADVRAHEDLSQEAAEAALPTDESFSVGSEAGTEAVRLRTLELEAEERRATREERKAVREAEERRDERERVRLKKGEQRGRPRNGKLRKGERKGKNGEQKGRLRK